MLNSTLILLINLDSRKDRLGKMKERLKYHDFIRIAAKSVNDQDCLDISPKTKLFLPEIACTISHINALKTFLETEHQTCIILEDDAVLGDYFSTFISKFKFLPKGVFVIKLETHLNKFYHSRLSIIEEGFKFNRMHSFHYGSAAYATSRSGAHAIIKELEEYNIPVDDVIFDHMVTSKEFGIAWQLNPACCIQEHHLFEDLKTDSDIAVSEKISFRKRNEVDTLKSSKVQFKRKILSSALKKIKKELVREVIKVKSFMTLKIRKKINYRE
jgi:glycosyl transferase family 25